GTSPCTISLPGSPPYVANNAEAGAGVMNLFDATVNSVNCAYIRLGVDVGLSKIVDMAHRLGIPAGVKLGTTPSLSIGSYEVTPLQMASVYSTLAADGVQRPPTFVQKVTDSSGPAARRRGSGRHRWHLPGVHLPRLHERRPRRPARGRLHGSRPEPDPARALPDRPGLARRPHRSTPAAGGASSSGSRRASCPASARPV